MAARSKPARSALRSWRQRLDVGGAVITGNPKESRIVYGYRFPSHPQRIKIGYSSRGLVRVAEQSTGFPEKPVIEFIIHNARARQIEASFHTALQSRQSDVIGTEWFDASWRDVLAVSPALRRAAGRNRVARAMRLGLSVLLALIGLMIYPALACVAAAVASAAEIRPAMSAAHGYLAALGTLSFPAVVDQGEALLQWAWARDVPWFVLVLAGVPVPLLARLPFARLRRQAF